jgi:hypothetical protein
MDLKSELAGRYLRIIAIISAAARARRCRAAARVSISVRAARSPQLGTMRFSFLTVFCLARTVRGRGPVDPRKLGRGAADRRDGDRTGAVPDRAAPT